MKLSALDVYEASKARSEFYRAISKLFATYDFLLLAERASVSIRRGHTLAKVDQRRNPWIHITAGWRPSFRHRSPGCRLSMCPWASAGTALPMGLQVVGRHHADFSLLADWRTPTNRQQTG